MVAKKKMNTFVAEKFGVSKKSANFLAINAVYCRKCINCKINLEISIILLIFVQRK